MTADKAGEAVRNAARELVERDKAREVARDLDSTLERLERRALREGGDDLIQAMRPAFGEAVAAVAVAVEQFGPLPNDAAILAAGPAPVAAWEARTTALRRLADVHAIRNALANAGYGERDPQAPWYVATAAAVADPERAETAFRDRFAGLVAAGFAIRLNTAAETVQLVGAARGATEKDREAASEAARRTGPGARKADLFIEGHRARIPKEPAPA